MNDKTTSSIKRIRTFADDFASHKVVAPVPVPKPAKVIAQPQDSPTTQAPSANPPFHFIRESVEGTKVPVPTAPKNQTSAPVKMEVSKIPAPPHTTSSMGGDHVYDLHEEDMQGGTIVREMRSSKFSLFNEIKKSLSNWISAKKDQAEETESQKPKVIAPSLRAQTISHAASLGVLPESDDHKKITVRLKEVPREARNSGVIIEDIASIPEAGWSYSETSDDPVDGAAKQVHDAAIDSLEEAVAPTYISQVPPVALPIITITDTKIKEPVRVLVPASLVIPQPNVLKEEVVTPTPQVEIPKPKTEPAISPIKQFENIVPRDIRVVTQEEIQDTLDDETKEFEEIEKPTPPTKQKFAPAREPKWRVPYVIIATCVAALVLGGATAFWLYGSSYNTSALSALSYQSVIGSDKQVPVVLHPQKNTYLTNISNEAAQIVNAVTIFYPTIATNEGGVTTATLNETLAVLNLTAPGTLTRNMSEFTFGSMGASSPFIIIQVQNFDTAFGGMLQWERSLATDVAPFFGTQPAASFLDMVYNNRDIRVAKRSDGSELMYTFIERTVIVITTNRDVLAEIINRQQ